MENKDYQWSIKLDNGEIFVVHSDTWEDLSLKREEVMNSIVIPVVKQRVSSDDPSYCKEHNIQMKEREGKYGKFYSHSKQDETGMWIYCKGEGF